MQAAFDEKFAQYLANKKGAIHIPNAAKYDSILAAIRKSQSGQPLISGDERNFATRFSISEVNGEQIVVKGNKIVVTQEQIFDLLHDTHRNILGHAGRDIMMKRLYNYFGLGKEIVQLYISLCKECHLKRSKAKKGLVVKPILSEKFNSRCQIDLMDMQARPDGEYNFILNYQDHLTKFVILRPLRKKTAAEV